MSLNKVFPVINASTTKLFFEYISHLNIPEIDYFAIGIQSLDKKTSISLMSLPEWQKVFIENQYANYDPLRRAAFYTKRKIIPFNEIDMVDSFGIEIMQQRAKLGIKNGLVLMERFEEYNYMITLGTGFLNFNAHDFATKYYGNLMLLKRDFIKLIEPEKQPFLLSPPSIGAK